MSWLKSWALRRHKRRGDRFGRMDLLYLTTVGARTGERRESALARFPDGDGGWLVVALNQGKPANPSWLSNVRAHPDQVQISFGGRLARVTVEELDVGAAEAALRRIAAAPPVCTGRPAGRRVPVLRLTPAPGSPLRSG